MFRKPLAAATTALVAAIFTFGAVAAPAVADDGSGPASAHASTVTPTVTCNSATSATITWSVYNDGNATGTISQATGNAASLVSPSPVGAQVDAASVAKFTQAVTTSDVGTTFTLGVQIQWPGYSQKHSSSSRVTIAGSNFSCGDDTSRTITICCPKGTGYFQDPVQVSAIITGTDGVTPQDIIPSFTYTQGGVQKTYPGQNWNAGGQLIFNNDCDLPAAPPAPSYTEAVCTAAGQVGSGYVVIPTGATGVQYSLNTGSGWTAVAAGTSTAVPAGTTVTVRVATLSGYELAYPTLPSTFRSHRFTNVSTSCVQPTAPTVVQAACTTAGSHSNGSYTITPTANVTYYVNNKKVTGTVAVTSFPSIVTITAVAKNGYTLVGTSSWTYTFTDPGACLQSVSTSVTFTDAICTGPGTSGDASYTLPEVDHISYQVSTDGVTYTAQDAGSYKLAQGDSVTVHAIPDAGYYVDGDASWTFAATDLAASCDQPAVPGDPSAVSAVCSDGESQNGAILVDFQPGVLSYTLIYPDGTKVPVTAASTSVPAGTYTVTVTAEPGYTLTGADQWPLEVTVDPAVDCGQLPTDAVLPTSVTSTAASCSTGSGSITVGPTADYLAFIDYSIDGQKVSGVTTAVKPGTHVVTAAVNQTTAPGDTLDDPGPWTVTIAAASVACAQLKTLALTGVSPVAPIIAAGILLPAGAALLLGAALIRRRRES